MRQFNAVRILRSSVKRMSATAMNRVPFSTRGTLAFRSSSSGANDLTVAGGAGRPPGVRSQALPPPRPFAPSAAPFGDLALAAAVAAVASVAATSCSQRSR